MGARALGVSGVELILGYLEKSATVSVIGVEVADLPQGEKSLRVSGDVD
jgi:hypothetical protein